MLSDMLVTPKQPPKGTLGRVSEQVTRGSVSRTQAPTRPGYQTHPPQLARPRPVSPFAPPALPWQSLETLHLHTRSVPLLLGGHHAGSQPVSKHWTLFIGGGQCSVTGRCSKWTLKMWRSKFNTIVRVTFLFSGPTTATSQGPSSRLTPTSVLHGGPPIILNTHDG